MTKYRIIRPARTEDVYNVEYLVEYEHGIGEWKPVVYSPWLGVIGGYGPELPCTFQTVKEAEDTVLALQEREKAKAAEENYRSWEIIKIIE